MDDRLYRSRSDRIISGVAAGLAERLDVDPSIVRVVWALLVLPTGFFALLAYVVMAIVVPEEPPQPADAGGAPLGVAAAGPGASAEGSPTTPSPAVQGWPATVPSAGLQAGRRAEREARRAARRADGSNGALVFGAILIVVGTLFFVRQFLPAIDFDIFWPSALVVLGVVLVIGSFRRG